LAENTLQAKRYSKAVFEIAQERNELEKWQSDLQKMAVLAQNAEFISVMENPSFSFQNKSRLLESQLKGISPLASNLALILTSQGKFRLIEGINAAYQELLDSFYGIDKAEVITAVPLDDQERLKLSNYLSGITGKKIVLKEKVDPHIIGGVIARVSGKIIDGSTSSQLASLKNEFINANN
jgi:F-type H+-transporting ATPase subunit delta